MARIPYPFPADASRSGSPHRADFELIDVEVEGLGGPAGIPAGVKFRIGTHL